MKVESAILLGLFAASPAAEALAQSPRDVPITQDLRREERIERRLDRDMPPPVDPNVTPDNPDGVVGFDGPPGVFENGVERGSPLSSGSLEEDDDDD
ncbi:hypothetical protein [Methylobacterium sp. 77]|uniref:hypothetical protein n=1 Tax=Methylobacterium sp. 77 TaxID=1101192 RepID=UPI00037B83E4|nr:hypothetical protein [Methylobacterium sp. 77]